MCCTIMLFIGQLDLAERVLARFEAIANASQLDPVFELMLLSARVNVYVHCRDSQARVLTTARRIGPLGDAIGTARARCDGYYYEGLALGLAGAFEEAVPLFRVVLAERGGFPPHYAASQLGLSLTMLGRREEALDVMTPYARGRSVESLWVCVCIAAFPHYYASDLSNAEQFASQIEPSTRKLPFFSSIVHGVLAKVALTRGNPSKALAHAEHALEEGGKTSIMLTRHGLIRAEALHALGRHEESKEVIRAAAERVLVVRDSIEEAPIRDRYLDAFPENRETLKRAEEWLPSIQESG
jgi:hypothetical protein